MVPMSAQREFNFRRTGSDEGYTAWITTRRVAVEEMARRINLPLGHQVEIWLRGGVRLRGKLRLQEEALFIEEDSARHLGLMVERVAFTYREMESCVRLD